MTRFDEFLWTPKCSVGKQITNCTIYNLQTNYKFYNLQFFTIWDLKG